MKAVLRSFLIVVAVLVAGYVGWGRVEAHRLANDIDAIAARGEPVESSAFDAPLPSDAHREAAQLYLEAAERAREMARPYPQFARLDVDAVVGRVNVAELEDTYRKDSQPLQMIDRAAALPFAGFGDLIDGPIWANDGGLQALGALGALRADLLAYRGDGDAAAQALIAAIGVQRTVASLFSRNQVASRQLGSLRILLRHTSPSAASLESLQRAFAQLPDEDGLVRDLMLRRSLLIEQGSRSLRPGGVPAGVAFLFQPFLTRAVRVQVEQFPEVLAAAREPWPDKFATLGALQGAAESPRSNRTYLRDILSGRVTNVAAISAFPVPAGQILAARRVAIAVLAVERHRRAHGGALPSSLDVLVPAFIPAVPMDPFTGKPLVFKPSADSYLLYSLDFNRNDDGGMLYGTGSMNPMPAPRQRDFGVRVPLEATRGAQ